MPLQHSSYNFEIADKALYYDGTLPALKQANADF
jgi:hypothetical protein